MEYIEEKPSLNEGKEAISPDMVGESFGKALCLGMEGSDTLEWVPAYFCEMSVLKSERSQQFVNQIFECLSEKGVLNEDKFKVSSTPVRYTLSDIRSGTLRERMQNEIKKCRFVCRLPNEHVRFGGIEKKDEETGEKLWTQGCMGKIIAEKIPRIMYYFNQNPMIRYVLVHEHERALFIKDGRILTELETGKHDIINRSKEFDIIDIYYFDIGNITGRWGTSTMLTDGKGSLSATQVRLRLNGSIVLRINNINNFFTNIVKNETEYYDGNLLNYLNSKLMQIINSEMSQTEPLSIYQDAEKVMSAVKVKKNEFFQDAGIEIIDLSVSTCKFDNDVEEIFRKRLEKIKVEGAEGDIKIDQRIHELQKLKELGVDINSYIQEGKVSPRRDLEKSELKLRERKLEVKENELSVGSASDTIQTSKKLSVFVSYSHKDTHLFKFREVAENLTKFDEIGNVLFYEGESYDNFVKYMNDNIGNCDVMLLFCSPNALESNVVEKEWTAADAISKPIIPIFIKLEHIPPLLKSRVGVEFDAFNFQKTIDEIYKIILKKAKQRIIDLKDLKSDF